eukprot:Gb_02609 [translate_table: standard]
MEAVVQVGNGWQRQWQWQVPPMEGILRRRNREKQLKWPGSKSRWQCQQGGHGHEILNANNVVVASTSIGHVEPEATKTKTERDYEKEAWELVRASVVNYCGNPIGTIAANDPTDPNILNYDQVFIRDFIPSGIACLLKGEYDIVRNFILHTLQLQVLPYIPSSRNTTITRATRI